MKYSKLFIVLLTVLLYSAVEAKLIGKSQPDLTVVGFIHAADGLGQIPIGVIDTLKDSLKMNFVVSRTSHTQEVSQQVLKVFNTPCSVPGKVALFFDLPWEPKNERYRHVPAGCTIKLAYSMFEATHIHPEWVRAFNNNFDGVVVPDEYHVQAYKDSGVTIPIFVVPFGIYLEDFLKAPLKTVAKKPFVFGCSAGFWVKKNYSLLLEAFASLFKNNPDVLLKLHGRSGQDLKNIQRKIKELGLKNVQLISGPLSRSEYIKFYNSLDAYVLLSKAEGFSITPREAMARGIPCILSDNTAHITLCKSNLVKAVPSFIKEPAYCHHYSQYIGYYFNTSLDDARKALSDVYYNYPTYLKKSAQARVWVQRYLWSNLKPYYLSLVKPPNVELGKENKVTPQGIVTSSISLFNKYKMI